MVLHSDSLNIRNKLLIMSKSSTYSINSDVGCRPTKINTNQEFTTLVENQEKMSFGNSCVLICKNLKSKMLDHLLLGGEHTKKVSQGFTTPIEWNSIIDNEEKRDIVLNDPKFGMFSLFAYHINKGYKNQELKKSNKVFCSHIFSLFFALPILIFISQWILYYALVAHEIKTFDGEFCPNKSTIENKLIIAGTGIVYFVRSFFIWDNLTSRIGLKKTNRVDNIPAILDTFQEFLFSLIVYCANLWIIFVEEDIQNMILNSLAMEFLMQLDNEFQEMYFTYLPGSAEDIYDNIYVSYKENRKLLTEKYRKSKYFKFFSYLLSIPYKLLVISIFLFPLLCFFIAVIGPICK